MFGERLKRARAAEGISLRELGRRVDLSAMTLSKYERDEVTPSSDVLIKLAEALRTPLDFFFRPHTVTFSNPKFRRKAGLGKKEIEQIREKALEKAERIFKLLTYFPKPPIGSFIIPDEIPTKVDSLASIDLIASALRDEWNLGQGEIPSIIDTLEAHGVFVLVIDFQDKNFDGLAATINGFHTIVIGSDWPGDRQRFTLAHELGHLVLDGRLEGLDEEKACNRFAGAFLLPSASMIQMLGAKRTDITAQELMDVKQKFGASMASILLRANEAGIISDAKSHEKWTEFIEKGWNKKEPGCEIPQEKTSLLERLVLRAVSEQLISLSKGAEMLDVSSTEIKRLIGGHQ